jgi:hypothetical protein
LNDSHAWPVDASPDAVCVTLRSVLDGTKPVLLVSHDASDGTWQMLTGDAFAADETRRVSLSGMVAHDARLLEVADLPLGWLAWRESPTAAWNRQAEADQTAD